MTFETVLSETFAAADATGAVHALDIDSGAAIGLRPDQPVVTASTFKVPVLIELLLQAEEGALSLLDRVAIPIQARAPGPTGTSLFLDAVELSLRDLACSMITVSDNAATDVICELIGLPRLAGRLRSWGLTQTRIPHDCRGIFRLGAEDLEGTGYTIATLPDGESLPPLRFLDPLRTNATTPQEMTSLLGRVWRDEIVPPTAGAVARAILGQQVWPHRITAGFPREVRVSGKTGTLPSVHNEVAVVEYPDGGRYAVAVFTKSASFSLRQPRLDAAIGRAARAAIDTLRSGRP